MKLRIALALLVGSLVSAACGSSSSTSSTGSGGGSSSSGSGDTCGKSGRTGDTDCGSHNCQAGQFCDSDDFNSCKAGCLADSNCAENQRCVVCGSDAVGVCRNCDQSAANVCGCEVDTIVSMACGAMGKPSLGMTCSSGQQPMVSGCTPGALEGDWCCPDPNASDAGPPSNCTRDTTEDQLQCGNGAPKAYFCPIDEEPNQTGCVQGPAIGSGIWCCPT
jgi:hypothetical protein